MNKLFKKWFALTLAVAMLISGAPVNQAWANAPQEGEDITADVTVNYMEGDNEVAPPTVVEAVYGETNTITAPKIGGFEVVGDTEYNVEVDENGIATPSEVTFIYEFVDGSEPTPADTGEVTVKYLDIQSEVISGSEIVEVILNEPVTITAKNLKGYIIVSENEYTVNLTESNPKEIVEFYYEVDESYVPEPEYGDIRINMLEDGTENEIKPVETRTVEPGNIMIEAPEILGYEVIGDVTKSIEINANETVDITFYYSEIEEGMVTINYEDTDGLMMQSNIKEKLSVGESKTFIAPEYEGYRIIGDSTVTLEITETLQELSHTFVYEPIKASYVITVVDNITGNQLTVSDEIQDLIGTRNLQLPKVDGYAISEGQPTTIDLIEEGKLYEITVKYEIIQPQIVVHFVDSEGNELAEDQIINPQLDVSVELNPVDIEGYVVVGTDSYTVTLTEEQPTAEFSFTYEEVLPQGTVTVKYLDQYGNPIIEDEVLELDLGTHTIDFIDFENYRLVNGSEVEVTLTEEEPDTEILFFYEEIEMEDVTFVYQDSEGNDIAPTEVTPMELGKYEFTIPDKIDGYYPANDELVVFEVTKDGINEVVFTYREITEEDKFGTIQVKYHDTEGNILDWNKSIKTLVGELKTIYAPMLEGYTVEGDNSVELLIEEEGEVLEHIFIYVADDVEEEVETVTVKVYHKERNGETFEVETFEDVEVGENTFKSKNFKGYDVIGSKTRTVDIDSPTTITFEYKKEEPSSGGGSGSGGSSRQPRRDRDDEREEKEEEEDLREIDNVEVTKIITRSEKVNFLTDEVVKVRRERAVIEIDVDELDTDKTVRAYVFNEDKERWVPVATVVDTREGIAETVENYTGEVIFLEVEEKVYTDVTSDDWFKDYVDRASAFGFVNGIVNELGNRNFQGDRALTKAEFYAMVARIFGASDEGEASLYNTLDTVKADSNQNWYEIYEEELMEKGYINSLATPEEMNSDITRIDAMVLLTELITEVEDISVQDARRFSDSEGLEGLSIINSVDGYPDGSLKPFDGLTRAETISLIIKTLEATGW